MSIAADMGKTTPRAESDRDARLFPTYRLIKPRRYSSGEPLL